MQFHESENDIVLLKKLFLFQIYFIFYLNFSFVNKFSKSYQQFLCVKIFFYIYVCDN